MLKRKSSVLSYTTVSTLLLIVVFSFVFLEPRNNENTIGKRPDIIMGYDIAVATDLSQMIEKSAFIVIGKYKAFSSSWNMARNPDDISQEDSENYTEGLLYTFIIDEVLKGELNERDILVNHRYSEIVSVLESDAVTDDRGVIVKEATIENVVSFTLHDPLYISPVLDAPYILFLDRDANSGYFHGPIEPFSIRITSDNNAVLESNLIDSEGYFEETISVGDAQSFSVYISKGVAIEDNISTMSPEDIVQQIISEVG